MSHDAIPLYRFATRADVALDATFDGGVLTSDGGLPWLVEADHTGPYVLSEDAVVEATGRRVQLAGVTVADFRDAIWSWCTSLERTARRCRDDAPKVLTPQERQRRLMERERERALRRRGTGYAEDIFAFSRLPASTSATRLTSPSRTIGRYRLVEWRNNRSPRASSLYRTTRAT